MSAYDRALNELNKLDIYYNPTMPRMHDPVIEEKYKVTRDTRVILIAEYEEDEIQWVCSTPIYTDYGET